MDDLSRKVAKWRRIMDYGRRSGAKFIDPASHDLTYDEDFPKVIRREKAEHEAKLHKEKVKRDKKP